MEKEKRKKKRMLRMASSQTLTPNWLLSNPSNSKYQSTQPQFFILDQKFRVTDLYFQWFQRKRSREEEGKRRRVSFYGYVHGGGGGSGACGSLLVMELSLMLNSFIGYVHSPKPESGFIDIYLLCHRRIPPLYCASLLYPHPHPHPHRERQGQGAGGGEEDEEEEKGDRDGEEEEEDCPDWPSLPYDFIDIIRSSLTTSGDCIRFSAISSSFNMIGRKKVGPTHPPWLLFLHSSQVYSLSDRDRKLSSTFRHPPQKVIGSGPGWIIAVNIDVNNATAFDALPPLRSWPYVDTSSYLLESPDGTGTLLVKRYIDFDAPREDTRFFVVLKCELGEDGECGEWVEVKSLDEWVLFVGENQSLALSANDFPELTPNSIYFVYNRYRGSPDMGIFRLESETIEPLPFSFSGDIGGGGSGSWPPPVWVPHAKGFRLGTRLA